MSISEIVGLNVKYYRYLKHWSQEKLAYTGNFKIAYISLIERFEANMTLKNIAQVAEVLGLEYYQLFIEETAKKAMKLPDRVDLFKDK